MWFWIWFALALGALGVGAWQLWVLWRRGLRAVRDAGRCADRLQTVAGDSAQRAEATIAARPARVTALAQDPIEVRARVTELRRQRELRAAHRRRPRPEVYERWLSIYR